MLVVQVVEIWWTKATRGAPRATQRARLPRRLPVDLETTPCLVQRLRMDERDDFALSRLGVEALPHAPGTIGVLRITSGKDGAFSLGMNGTPHGGQPRRRPHDGAIALRPGQWASLAINARHTSYSGQFYSETVFNVACGSAIAANVFLLGEPDHALDLKADLF